MVGSPLGRLRILAPVSRVDEVEDVITAGADELYCGVLPDEWLRRYTIASLNRRPAKTANFKSFEELQKCVETAHSHNIPVYLTLNEHYYTFEQYPLLLNYVDKAVKIGVDAFIVADLALVETLKEIGVSVNLQMSTGGVILNSRTVRFFKELGISRVHLDRHLTIEEIENLMKNIPPYMETSVFILNSRCPNIDGLCTFDHLVGKGVAFKNPCMLPYEITVSTQYNKYESREKQEFKERVACERQHVWEEIHMDSRPCGACALYFFDKIGVTSVKIVGRGNSKIKKIVDVRFIRTLIDFLRNEKLGFKEFSTLAKTLYTNTYGLPCRVIMCYYPDINKKMLG